MNNLNCVNIRCQNCNYNNFIVQNNIITCGNCNTILSNKYNTKNIDEKNKNKFIHLKNVLKNLETIDVTLVNKWFDKLSKTITNDKIDKIFIDMTYICEFLKNYGIKKYILDMWLFNKYKNIKFKLTNFEKEFIKIVFIEFIKFLYNIEHNALKNISYHQVLYIIYKYLDTDINIKPSITRNNNENLSQLFDNFLNNLCEKYYENNKNHNNIVLNHDKIDNYPNIYFKKNLYR